MINTENISCPICDGLSFSKIFSRPDYLYTTTSHPFDVVRCKNCKLVFVNPRPSEADIHSFYPDNFYNTDLTAEETIIDKCKSLAGKYEKVKALPKGNLLDIGCAKGEFLYMMKVKGWNVTGFDFSTTPPNLFNLDIKYGELDKASLMPEQYDLVTLWGVLEHVYHPAKMLRAINKLVKPGGSLVMLVTNFNSIPMRFMRHDDVPRHTTMFTKSTMTKILEQTGFSPVNYYFDQDIFGGSHRGLLTYIAKSFAGEKLDEIVAQNRTPDRWNEFTTQLIGRDSHFIRMVDQFDSQITPLIDKIAAVFGFGAIMTVRAIKKLTIVDVDYSTVIDLQKPFKKVKGNAWHVAIPDYLNVSDNSDSPNRSSLVLIENDKPLFNNHSVHADVIKLGRGRYSHWNDELIFSSSDNTNPNNKRYQVALSKGSN